MSQSWFCILKNCLGSVHGAEVMDLLPFHVFLPNLTILPDAVPRILPSCVYGMMQPMAEEGNWQTPQLMCTGSLAKLPTQCKLLLALLHLRCSARRCGLLQARWRSCARDPMHRMSSSLRRCGCVSSCGFVPLTLPVKLVLGCLRAERPVN